MDFVCFLQYKLNISLQTIQCLLLLASSCLSLRQAVRLSLSPHGTTRLPQEDYLKNWYLGLMFISSFIIIGFK